MSRARPASSAEPRPTEQRELIRSAIRLVNEVADGAGDEDVTPSEIARIIRSARVAAETAPPSMAAKYLDEALDAVSDGMPADYVAMILYAALGASQTL